jgi:chromosomal replication initiation ATPase DnaA
MLVTPNIFIPRNDWNVISFNCNKHNRIDRVVSSIVLEVKKETGIDVLNERNSRRRNLVEARQLFFVMMTKFTRRSYSSISGILGMDHATINHSINTVRNLCDTDQEFKRKFEKIETHIKLLNN